MHSAAHLEKASHKIKAGTLVNRASGDIRKLRVCYQKVERIFFCRSKGLFHTGNMNDGMLIENLHSKTCESRVVLDQ